MNRTVLYIQYTNPAGYPPLVHSSRILADRGWQVVFAGVHAADSLPLRFAEHPSIRVLSLYRPAGTLLRRLHFLAFCAWTLWHAVRLRPAWIYASDAFSALPTLVARAFTGAHVVYHEHDAPPPKRMKRLANLQLAFRRRLARRADLNVLPSAGRIESFRAETGAPPGSIVQVWNCPSKSEAAIAPAAHDGATLWVYYHGSVNPELVPATLLDALRELPDNVCLRIVGYETLGSRGFARDFLALAARRGLAPHRVEYAGTLQRAEMLALAASSDVGLMLAPRHASNANLASLFGASNKCFEYMLCGLPQLVTSMPEWVDNIEKPGYGVACDPDDAASIARALRRLDDVALLRRMGLAARARIVSDWNYETQFSPVLRRMEA